MEYMVLSALLSTSVWSMDMIISIFQQREIFQNFSSVTCGYYGTQDGIYAYWKDCPEGDNIQKMTYWIRY